MPLAPPMFAAPLVEAERRAGGSLVLRCLAENFKLGSGTWVDAGAVRLGVNAAVARPA